MLKIGRRHVRCSYAPQPRKGQNDMNWQRIRDQWKRLKVPFTPTPTRLTPSELGMSAARRAELLGMLWKRYEGLRADTGRQIDNLIAHMSAKHVRPDQSDPSDRRERSSGQSFP
jgi:hypothetical protein